MKTAVTNEGSTIIGALADRGKVRESNEDRSFYCKFDVPGEESGGVGILAAVADGMGGHAAGEAASEKAIQVLQSRFCGRASSTADNTDWEGFLVETIRQANREVHEEAQRWKGRSGMGTTVTASVLIDDRVIIGHVGDSRAYYIHDGSISRLTEDHTWTADQVRRGLMTEEQAAVSDKAGQLMRVLGIKPEVEVYTTTKTLSPGDVILLCTDGLTGVMTDQEIFKAICNSRTPQAACQRLIAMTNRRGGPDNTAVLIISYNPQLAVRQTQVSSKSTRKKMLAGLAAVLALLAVDVAYLALQYSKTPKPPSTPPAKAKFTPPVTVTVREAPVPAQPSAVDEQDNIPSQEESSAVEETPVPEPEQPVEADDAEQTPEENVPAERLDPADEEHPSNELTIRDMSGEVITITGGGEKR